MAGMKDLGRYFEDFQIGDVYRNPVGRTISNVDNTWFTLLTMNTNQTHFNEDFAAKSEFGKPLVNSGLTVAILLGLSVPDTSQHAIANLGWADIKLTHPVFAGDTLYAESRILNLRESKSRPHVGIVTARSRALNQDGAVCISWVRSVMVLKRDADQGREVFPVPNSKIEEMDPGIPRDGG